MNRPRVVRFLRIAFTAICGFACVLLVCLWVRSYWRFEQLIHRTSASDYFAVTTHRGQLAVGYSNESMLAKVFPRDWIGHGFPETDRSLTKGSPFAVFPTSTKIFGKPDPIVQLPRFHSPFVMPRSGSSSAELVVPYWLLVFFASAIAVSPWLRWRFSLRSLLIVTTLIAALLGLSAWASRSQ